MKVTNLYDSHVHWLGSGLMRSTLALGELKSEEEISKLEVTVSHYRGEWLTGRGWDHNKWPSGKTPSKESLDQAFGSTPVFFTRADGHAAWVNTAALKKMNHWHRSRVEDEPGFFIERYENGDPTGLILDLAMTPYYGALPKRSLKEVKEGLLSGMEYFHQGGFTHIRDMSCSELQWKASRELEMEGNLHLAVEQWFDADSPENYQTPLKLSLKAREEKSNLLRVQGVKVYADGALGSEGASLSKPYLSRDDGWQGLDLMDEELIEAILSEVWDEGLGVAVHSIGDRSSHRVAKVARRLWDQGLEGKLCLEHCEILRTDTISLLKGQNVSCFMQPCHWLTDRGWLKKKVDPSLHQHLFPWARIEQSGIEFYFGSDAPIEPASLALNVEALRASHEVGILPVNHEAHLYQSHPDHNWVKGCETIFDKNLQLKEVYFDQKRVV